MKRDFLRPANVVGVFLAALVLWIARIFDTFLSRRNQVIGVTGEQTGWWGPHAGLVALLCVVVAICLAAMIAHRKPTSIKEVLIFCVVFWVAITAVRLFELWSVPGRKPMPLVVELIGFIGAGLIIYAEQRFGNSHSSTAETTGTGSSFAR